MRLPPSVFDQQWYLVLGHAASPTVRGASTLLLALSRAAGRLVPAASGAAAPAAAPEPADSLAAPVADLLGAVPLTAAASWPVPRCFFEQLVAAERECDAASARLERAHRRRRDFFVSRLRAELLQLLSLQPLEAWQRLDDAFARRRSPVAAIEDLVDVLLSGRSLAPD